MTKNVVIKPLGLVLRKAGLISSEQIEKALQESPLLPQYKIGEIMAIRGWIKPETADFFAEAWPQILQGKKSLTSLATKAIADNQDLAACLSNITNDSPEQFKTFSPLGQYLKAANLIDDKQIEQILQIQQRNSSKFGKIAVEKGIISQTTLEFFLEHLNLLKTEETIQTYSEKLAIELDRIERYILNNHKCEPTQLLKRYQAIKQRGTMIASGDVIDRELVASGILVLDKNILRIAKPDYGQTFNDDWLEKELANLHPYNQIRFKMFALNDKADLPYKVINAINYWTNHQPFLTQKIYQLIQEQPLAIPSGQEANIVTELVYQNIIDNWETGLAASHFQQISYRIHQNQLSSPQALFKTYKKIWQLKEINADGSIEQQELIEIGLIKINNNLVKVSNRIYQVVFDRLWLEQQFNLISNYKLPITSEKTFPDSSSKIPTQSVNRYHYKFLYLIVFLLSLMIVPFVIKLWENSQQPNQLLEQGHFFLKNQQYQKALSTYYQFFKINED